MCLPYYRSRSFYSGYKKKAGYPRSRSFASRRKIPQSQFDSASYAKGVRAGIAKAKSGRRY